MSRDDNWLYQSRNEAAEAAAITRQFKLTDALGDYSRKLKKAVFIWLSILFPAKHYHIKISKIPWLDVQIPDDRADVFAVVVAVPLIYSLVTFLVQAIADVLAWRTRFDNDIARLAGSAVQTAGEWVRRLGLAVDGDVPLRGVSEETVRESVANATAAINGTSKHLNEDYPWFWEESGTFIKDMQELQAFRNKLAHSILDVSEEALARPLEQGIGFIQWKGGEPITEAEFND